MSNFEKIQAIATPIEVPLRWSDQDINGHVNNVRILTLMEEARIRATQEWTATTPGASGPIRAARALNASFAKEVNYGIDTRIWVWLNHIGNTSFVFGHLLVQDGQPCVYSEATMVMVDRETGKPKRLGDEDRQEFERHLGPAFMTD